MSGLRVEFVQEHADQIASACEKGLTNEVGHDFTAKMRHVDAADHRTAVECDGPVVHAPLTIGDEEEGPTLLAHVVASRDEAAVVAGLSLGQDAEAIEEATQGELSAELRKAFGNVVEEMLLAVCEALEGVLPDDVDVGEVREIEEPRGEEAWLPHRHFVRMQLGLDCDLIEDGLLFVLVPAVGGATSRGGPAAIVFLEHCPEEFDRLEVMGDSLPCEVSVEEPRQYLGALEEQLEDAVVVVPWDMAGCSGLELVESLSGDARFAGARLAMSSDWVTRGRVRAALRAGARSFLTRPYQLDEILARLFPARDEEPDDTQDACGEGAGGAQSPAEAETDAASRTASAGAPEDEVADDPDRERDEREPEGG